MLTSEERLRRSAVLEDCIERLKIGIARREFESEMHYQIRCAQWARALEGMMAMCLRDLHSLPGEVTCCAGPRSDSCPTCGASFAGLFSAHPSELPKIIQDALKQAKRTNGAGKKKVQPS